MGFGFFVGFFFSFCFVLFCSPSLIILTSLNLDSLFSGPGTMRTSLSYLAFGQPCLPVTSAWGALSHAHLITGHIAAQCPSCDSLLLSKHLVLWVNIETLFKKLIPPSYSFSQEGSSKFKRKTAGEALTPRKYAVVA